jgi:uncharacterized protein YacL
VTLQVLRGLFILMMAAIAWFFITTDPEQLGPLLADRAWMLLALPLTAGVAVVCVDIVAPRGKLQVFSGVFFGLLVGLTLAFSFSFMIPFLVDLFVQSPDTSGRDPLVNFLNLLVGAICCYFAISFILQTRDDFRFVIPYVEFRKESRGGLPMLLDTAVFIDGRIRELIDSPLFDARLIVPRFVLRELQALSDSSERIKRERGRRGLDVLEDVRQKREDVVIYDTSGSRFGEGKESKETRKGKPIGVDAKLVQLAKKLQARLVTVDHGLTKVADLEGVAAINLHDLGTILRRTALPGEAVELALLKPGDQPNQAVGYLDDGSMVVVEHAAGRIGETVTAIITNTRQTTAGTLAFARLQSGPTAGDSDLTLRLPRRKKAPA